MNIILLVLSMMFFHIIDDYYLQGWLASAKQKKWWEQNAPNPLYKNDYKMALAEHAFSWTFMIHVPMIVYCKIVGFSIDPVMFLIVFIINWLIHMIADTIKANMLKINLIQDQTIHILQILITCIVYITQMEVRQ